METVEEPFQVPKDYTNGFHLFDEDLQQKRTEIYNQINYLLNMLKQIDEVYDRGSEVLSEQQVREYLKLDSIDPNMKIPTDIPKIRVGVKFVYYMKDVTKFLESRRRGGKF